jgi:hypothetical protein
MITIHGANIHEENIEAISIKNQKTLLDEQLPFGRRAQTKHQIKVEVAQKGIACTRAAQREHKDFEENSIPKGF